MNIKPPNKKDEVHQKYKYLIWRDGVGFLHLDSFSVEEMKAFSDNLNKHIYKASEDVSANSKANKAR